MHGNPRLSKSIVIKFEQFKFLGRCNGALNRCDKLCVFGLFARLSVVCVSLC